MATRIKALTKSAAKMSRNRATDYSGETFDDTLPGILEEPRDETAHNMVEGTHSNDRPSAALARVPQFVQRGTRHSDRPVTSFGHENVHHQHQNPNTTSSQASGLSYIPGRSDIISTRAIYRSSSSQETIITSHPAGMISLSPFSLAFRMKTNRNLPLNLLIWNFRLTRSFSTKRN